MTENRARIEYIDLFRFFGILCMIMGHIRFGSMFAKWIHGFHMPLFFFISGWFFNSNKIFPLSEYISKKAKRLIIPYVVFVVFQLFLCCIFIDEYRSLKMLFYVFFENTFKIEVSSSNFGISPVPGAMWFLTAIFFAETIYAFLEKFLHYSAKLHCIVILLSIAGMTATRFLDFRLPWALDASFVGIAFFHAARVLKRHEACRVLNLNLLWTMSLCVIAGAMIMLSPAVNMRTGSYGYYFPFLINAFLAVLAGWNVSRHIDAFMNKGKCLKPVSDYFKSVGKNSIVYLCFNQLVILLSAKIIFASGLKGLVAKLIILFITMAVLFLFEKIIFGSRLKSLLGK